MPFNFNAPSFFGKLGPQSAGFNPNNAVAGFQRANAISGAVPNLFTTIQMTQKNQQDRRAKEAAIAQALAGLVKTQQEVQQAPLEAAYKQAQIQKALYDMNPQSLDNLKILQDMENKRQELLLDEQETYRKSSMKPVTRDAILGLSPQERRETLRGRQAGTVSGKNYIFDKSLQSNNKGRLSPEEFDRRQGINLNNQKELINYRASEAAPMPAEAAGRYVFAEESVKNIPKIKSLLFKDGVFNQGLVNKAVAGKYTKDKDVQDLKRWVVGNLTARGLIQSGTVVKDNEWARLAEQFGIDLFSAPEAALSSLNEQEAFMKNFMQRLRPGIKVSDSVDTNPLAPAVDSDIDPLGIL